MLRINPEISKKKRQVEWLRSMMTYDELLGWKHVSNASVWSKSSEYTVLYNINSKGLRDVERGYDRAKGKFRILCLGDSVTFGWGVNTEDRFTNVLENYFTNVEVINAGVQGYGIDQELLFLRQEGIKFHPDLILIYLIPHDFIRALYSKIWDRPKPLFYLSDKKELMLANIPVPKVDIFSFHNPTLDQIRYHLAKKSYLFWLLQDRIYLWNEAKIKPVNKDDIDMELAEALLKNIQKVSRFCNAQLVIVGSLPQGIEVFLRENNINFLEDPLSFYNGSQFDIRYVEFGHPNVFGNKLIAEGIYKFLVENNLVPKEYLFKK